MRKIYIIGAGGFASELTEYILDNNEEHIVGYFDKNDHEHKRYGYKAPYLGNEDFSDLKDKNIVLSIADATLRTALFLKLKKRGCIFPNIIHHNTFIAKSSRIKCGAIICPFVSLLSNCSIGENFQANVYSYISHDCVIRNNVTFAPSVKCNGNVIIQDNVYIGTGAIIRQGSANSPLIIGQGATIGAGAVVLRSVEPNSTMVGAPARALQIK